MCRQLKQIVQDSASPAVNGVKVTAGSQRSAVGPVGLLTAADRDTWAAARLRLLSGQFCSVIVAY